MIERADSFKGSWRMRRHRLGACTSGAAAVEFAFVVPVLFAGLFLVVEFSRVMYSKIEFEYAMFNATRFGMVMKTADTAKVTKAVSDNFILLDPTHLTSVSFSEVANPDKTRTATLTASYDVQFLVALTSSKSITLSRSVSFLRAN